MDDLFSPLVVDDDGRQHERRHVRWVEDWEAERCQYCNVRFTFFTRRHHCRWCGKVVCAVCSPKECELRGGHRVRVCVPCYTSLTSITGEGSDTLEDLNLLQGSKSSVPAPMPPSQQQYYNHMRAGVRAQQRQERSGSMGSGSEVSWDWDEQLMQQEQRRKGGGHSGTPRESPSNSHGDPPGVHSGTPRRAGVEQGRNGSSWVRNRRGMEGRHHIGTLYMKVAEAIHLPACERLTDSSRPYVRLCLTGTASCGQEWDPPLRRLHTTSVKYTNKSFEGNKRDLSYDFILYDCIDCCRAFCEPTVGGGMRARIMWPSYTGLGSRGSETQAVKSYKKIKWQNNPVHIYDDLS